MAEDQKASVGPQRVSAPPIVAPGVPLTFCPLALKWRNPATGRFAKTPAAVLLTQEEKAYVAECKAAAAAVAAPTDAAAGAVATAAAVCAQIIGGCGQTDHHDLPNIIIQ